MESSFFVRSEFLSEEGQKFELTYELIAEDVTGADGKLICENYGVAVRMESGDEQTYIEVPNITVDQTRILNLLVLLSVHQVTPTAVCDVLDDWL